MSNNFLSLYEPYLIGNEKKYVMECIETAWVSSAGKYVDTFEKKLAAYSGSKYTVACINGTAALHMALLLSGINENDEVIVPDLTFIATVNVVSYLRAKPIFMDINSIDFNIDVSKLKEFCEHECKFDGKNLINNKTNRKVKAIIPVHIYGCPCNMMGIKKIARRYNLKIIEDAAEALGSKIENKMVGTFGDIGCLSFNGNKIITTGGGGMILTDNKEIAAKAKHLTQQAKIPSADYIHDMVGFNYRLNNVSAAIGVAQLEKLEEILANKKKIKNWYKERLIGHKRLSLVEYEENNKTVNYWLILLKTDSELTMLDLVKKISAKNIQTRLLWRPLHLQQPYKNAQKFKIENSIKAYNSHLVLPSGPGLSKNEIDYIVTSIEKVLGRLD